MGYYLPHFEEMLPHAGIDKHNSRFFLSVGSGSRFSVCDMLLYTYYFDKKSPKSSALAVVEISGGQSERRSSRSYGHVNSFDRKPIMASEKSGGENDVIR